MPARPTTRRWLAGLPVADETSSGRRIIRLSGGGWGPGELIQDQPGDTWRWRPAPAVDSTPALQADRWSQIGQPGTEPDLVIRVDAFLPWRGALGWRIERRGRQRLQAALPGAALSQSMMTLARSRGIAPARPDWEILTEQPRRQNGHKKDLGPFDSALPC
jgi:hypothetical protein